jgi:aminoglycoside phosphotransferase
MGQRRLGGRIGVLLSARGLVATLSEGSPADGVEYRFDIENTVGMFADVLARLHTTPVSDAESAGAVQLSPADLVAAARSALPSERSLSDAYRHMSHERLLEALAASSPDSLDASDPVLTHGRPALGNLRCRQGVPIGLVAWDQLALADVHRDLAIAARSIAVDLGPIAVPAFFDAYSRSRAGWMPDLVRLDWYALAAELTS